VVFYAAAAITLLKNAGPRMELWLGPAVRSWIVRLSGASFGIYLLHPMILDTLIKGRLGWTLKGDCFHPAWMIPLTAFVVYGFSFLVVFAIRKIPVLKRIV